MWFAPRCGVGLNDSLGRRCPAHAPNSCSPTPSPNTTTTWRSRVVPWGYEARTTARAREEPHQDLSEAGSAGRILRGVAPGRSRGVAGDSADATHRACEVPIAADERGALCDRRC